MTDADRKTWHDTALIAPRDAARRQYGGRSGRRRWSTQVTAAEAMLKTGGERAGGSARQPSPMTTTKLARSASRRLGLNQPLAVVAVAGFGGQQGMCAARLGQSEGPDHGLDLAADGATGAHPPVELREDLTKVVTDTNELITAIPAIYDTLGASGAKPAALKPVGPIPAALKTNNVDNGRERRRNEETVTGRLCSRTRCAGVVKGRCAGQLDDLLHHKRQSRQGRGPWRPCRRRRAMRGAGQGGRRAGDSRMARVPEHVGGERPAGRQCKGSHRDAGRGSMPRACRSRPALPTFTATRTSCRRRTR